ncbi:DUF1906 domain-containing protein [Paenibacillaceae bacterium WGS1546]|uniref:DUF1906 domain-containing protein n=1 Tax=Cohnella sp. WGS1546 TaxID=3366810 RepID=UPI00372D1D57
MARNGIGVDRATPFSSNEDVALWCLANNGVRAVGRYYGTAWKRLTASEVMLLAEHGLEIWSVYQGSGNNYNYFSYNQGLSDAAAAETQATDAGQLTYGAIYFAVDYDASATQLENNIKRYFEGVQYHFRNNASKKYKIGVYGSYRTVRYIYSNVTDVVYKWQTYAWSQGQIDAGAHIYQKENDTTFPPCNSGNNNIGIIDKNDLDDTNGLTSFGGWYAGN